MFASQRHPEEVCELHRPPSWSSSHPTVNTVASVELFSNPVTYSPPYTEPWFLFLVCTGILMESDALPPPPSAPLHRQEQSHNDAEEQKRPSLLELGEETMAQAMLIFLLADLRILSATGRIRTKFEHLALDSDRSPRLTSQDYAGFFDYEETNGVTASHIMAILLVEIRREAEDVRKHRGDTRKKGKHKVHHQPALLSPWGSSGVSGSAGGDVNAKKVFQRDIRAANGMPSLLHCYNEMLSNDVSPSISKVSRILYPLDEDMLPKRNIQIHTPGGELQSVIESDSAGRDPVKSTESPALGSDQDDSLIGSSSNGKTTKSQHTGPIRIPHNPNGASDTLLETTAQLTSTSDPTLSASGHGAASSSRFHLRRMSSSLHVAHFDPNVELDDDDEDSATFHLNLNLSLLPKNRSQHESADEQDKNDEEERSNGRSRSENEREAETRAQRFKERLREQKEKIIERVEKAIPDKLASRVTQIAQNFPMSPAAREEQRMNEMAQIQTQLLNWDEIEESLKGNDPRFTFDDHTSSNNIPLATKLDVGQSPSSQGIELTTTDHTPGEFQLASETPHFHDSSTIRELILQALDSRDFWRLGFIKNFFKEGTVSHVLANSSAEMVWLSDWHTQYECTYALSIDREKKKVLLAFRGAYTERDWRHIVDWYDTGTTNPVKEDYPNRAKHIRVHSGFHKYLFRVRKDTGTTKYDEIAAKLDHYCSITGSDRTKITITGHSLGAALAAIFSLYASTEERFTSHGRAIECVTFGAPCIGNWRFAGAVKHQEDVGKLRIAKFHVKGDSVPHLPPALFRKSSRGAQYWHSGIDVSLPYIRKGKLFRCIFGGQPQPTVTYWDPDAESYFGSLFRQFREYYVWNLPVRFWRFAMFHTLVEHKKRMALVNKTDSSSLLATCSLKELYDMRHQLRRGTRRPRNR